MRTWRLSGCIGLFLLVSVFPAFGTSALTLTIDGRNDLFQNLTSNRADEEAPLALGDPDVDAEGPQTWKFQFDPDKGILGMRTDSVGLPFDRIAPALQGTPTFVPELQLTPAQFEAVLLSTRTYISPYQLENEKLSFFSWNGSSPVLNVWDFAAMDPLAVDPPVEAPEPAPLVMIACGVALIAVGVLRRTSRTTH